MVDKAYRVNPTLGGVGADMSQRSNCWESMHCGREPGGTKVGELGICPASVETSLNGVNSGINGGRICWALTGTLCSGVVQGSYAEKRLSCLNCQHLDRVRDEESSGRFSLLIPGQAYAPETRPPLSGQDPSVEFSRPEIAGTQSKSKATNHQLARAYWQGVMDGLELQKGKGNRTYPAAPDNE